MRGPFPRILAGLPAALLLGCSSARAPESPTALPQPGYSKIVSGASDSVESIPGKPGAPYVFRFRQTDPASDRFTYQDRDVSFHFRPAPDALYFQVENRQNRPVSIDWERSTFYDANGRSGKVAHSSTRWKDRFQAMASTQIAGLQRYGDYVIPLFTLLDSPDTDQQLHRPLLPEDSTSPQYADRSFGVDLLFLVEDRPRTYSFRFRVASVIPRTAR